MPTHLEMSLALQFRLWGVPEPEEEYRFCERKWRFDFAWPSLKLACEVEGGTFNRSRHTRPIGYRNDCIKYNEALLLGWRVLRVTSDMVNDGTARATVQRALEQTECGT